MRGSLWSPPNPSSGCKRWGCPPAPTPTGGAAHELLGHDVVLEIGVDAEEEADAAPVAALAELLHLWAQVCYLRRGHTAPNDPPKIPSRHLQARHVAQRVLVAVADHGRELRVVQELGMGVSRKRWSWRFP